MTKSNSDELREGLADLVEQHFPKGKCKERGQAMVLVAYAEILATQIIDRARVEELEKLPKPDIDEELSAQYDLIIPEETMGFRYYAQRVEDRIKQLKQKGGE